MSDLGKCRRHVHAPSMMGLGTLFQSDGNQRDIVDERPDSGPLEASSATASGQEQRNGPLSREPQLARPVNSEATPPEPQPTASSAGSPENRVPSAPTGVSAITADVLKEQQTLDSVIHTVCGWMESPDTAPDHNRLHSLNPESPTSVGTTTNLGGQKRNFCTGILCVRMDRYGT